MKGILRIVCAIFLTTSCAMLIGCATTKGQVQERLDLLDVLGLEEQDGWSLLTSPTDIWKVGSVMVFSNSGKPDWETNINEDPFNCISEDHWLVDDGGAPNFKRNKAVAYNLNLTKTLGISEDDLATIGIGDEDSDEPNYQSTIELNDVIVKSLNRGAAKKFIREEYASLDVDCQNYINSANSYIIEQTYAVTGGTIKIERINGANINLNLLEDSLNSGFKVTADDSISMEGSEIVVAIRAADFSDALRAAGVELRRPQENLDERLIESKDAIVGTSPPPNYWTLGAIALGTTLVLSQLGDGDDDDDDPLATTTPVILNLTLPPAE